VQENLDDSFLRRSSRLCQEERRIQRCWKCQKEQGDCSVRGFCWRRRSCWSHPTGYYPRSPQQWCCSISVQGDTGRHSHWIPPDSAWGCFCCSARSG
jgi:hypothetical protein